MSKARKLPSGSWNVQVYEGKDEAGKKIWTSFTAPTKAEAEYLAAEYRTGRKKKSPATELTVGEAVDKYIMLSEPVLSPASVRSYKFIRAHAFPDLMQVKATALTADLVQEAINREIRRPGARDGRPRAPKTVRSEWGLVSAALKQVCSLVFSPKLPPVQPHVKEFPEPAEVVAAIRGTDVELPCMLALWLSFTMSEIRGLMCSSVHDGCIFIRQTAVQVGSEEVVKPTAKNSTRLRKHTLPPYLLGLIQSSEPYRLYAETGIDFPLVPMTRNVIYKHWKRICSARGFSMTFHDLRHMSASVMLLLDVPEKYALERGGWSTPHVMKSVYLRAGPRRCPDQRLLRGHADARNRQSLNESLNERRILLIFRTFFVSSILTAFTTSWPRIYVRGFAFTGFRACCDFAARADFCLDF